MEPNEKEERSLSSRKEEKTERENKEANLENEEMKMEMESPLAQEDKEEADVSNQAEEEMFVLFRFELGRIQSVLDSMDHEFGKEDKFFDFTHFMTNFEKVFELTSICAEELCNQLFHIELEDYSKAFRRLVHNYKHQILNLVRVNVNLQEQANFGVNEIPVLARDYLPNKFNVDPMQEKFYFFRYRFIRDQIFFHFKKYKEATSAHFGQMESLASGLKVHASVLGEVQEIIRESEGLIRKALEMTDFEEFSSKYLHETSESEFIINHRKSIEKETQTDFGFVSIQENKKVQNELEKLRNFLEEQDQKIIENNKNIEKLEKELSKALEEKEDQKKEIWKLNETLARETKAKIQAQAMEKILSNQLFSWEEELKGLRKEKETYDKEKEELMTSKDEWKKRYDQKEEAFKNYVRGQHGIHMVNESEIAELNQRIKELEQDKADEKLREPRTNSVASKRSRERDGQTPNKARGKEKELSELVLQKALGERDGFVVSPTRGRRDLNLDSFYGALGIGNLEERDSKKSKDNILETGPSLKRKSLVPEFKGKKEKEQVSLGLSGRSFQAQNNLNLPKIPGNRRPVSKNGANESRTSPSEIFEQIRGESRSRQSHRESPAFRNTFENTDSQDTLDYKREYSDSSGPPSGFSKTPGKVAIPEETLKELLNILSGGPAEFSDKEQTYNVGQSHEMTMRERIEQTKRILKANTALSESEKDQYVASILKFMEAKNKNYAHRPEDGEEKSEKSSNSGRTSPNKTDSNWQGKPGSRQNQGKKRIQRNSIHENKKERFLIKEEDLREIFATGKGKGISPTKKTPENNINQLLKKDTAESKKETKEKPSKEEKPEEKPPVNVCPFHFGMAFKKVSLILEEESELESETNRDSSLKEAYTELKNKFYEDPVQFNMQFQFIHSLEAMKNYRSEFMSFTEFRKYYKLFFQAHQEVCLCCANLEKYYTRISQKNEKDSKPVFPMSRKTITRIPVFASDGKTMSEGKK